MGRERAHALLLALTLVSCDRAPAKEAPAPTTTAPTNAPTTVVVPTENAPITVPAPTAADPAARAPGVAAPSDPRADGSARIGTAIPTTERTTGAMPKESPYGTSSTEPNSGAVRPRVAKESPYATPSTAPSKGAALDHLPKESPYAPAKPAPTAPTTPPPNVPPPRIPTPPPPPGTPFATKVIVAEKLFRIELAPPAPCAPATACTATLVVHSFDGYKVNAEYPTKFVAKASPGVTVDGTGSFAVSAKTVGTMTVTFRAAQAGTAHLAGAFKLSVCTDEICEIAAPAIVFDVPVTSP